MDPATLLTAIGGAFTGAAAFAGALAAWARLGPDRTATVVGYQLEVLRDVRKRNKELGKENARHRRRIKSLEDRILALELAQDEPPPHLG